MTREIKFRAKIVMDIEPLAMKKGHWVEGHYYEDLHQGEWCSWIQECNDITHYKVDKNTLGQFTGLLDKNGKEIYEGDIIKTKRYGVVHGQLNTQGADLFRVVYKNAQFYIENKLRHFYLQDSRCNEVIGNIYDNPELLKTETL